MVSTKLIRLPWNRVPRATDITSSVSTILLLFNKSDWKFQIPFHWNNVLFHINEWRHQTIFLNVRRFRIEENPSASVHPAPADPRQAWRFPWSRYTATVWNIILFTSFTLIHVYLPGLNLLSKLFRLVDKITVVVVGHHDSLHSRGVTDNPPVVVTIPASPLCSPVWGEGQNSPLGQLIHDPPLFRVTFLVSWQR